MKFTKIIHGMAQICWKIARPTTVGVRILLTTNGSILLVKHTYQDYWYLPGGGVKKHETIYEAIHREIREEIGGTIGDIKLFNVYSSFVDGKNDHIILFVSNDFDYTASEGKRDKEIEQVRQFTLDELPTNVSPGTRRRIEEFKGIKSAAGMKW